MAVEEHACDSGELRIRPSTLSISGSEQILGNLVDISTKAHVRYTATHVADVDRIISQLPLNSEVPLVHVGHRDDVRVIKERLAVQKIVGGCMWVGRG